MSFSESALNDLQIRAIFNSSCYNEFARKQFKSTARDILSAS